MDRYNGLQLILYFSVHEIEKRINVPSRPRVANDPLLIEYIIITKYRYIQTRFANVAFDIKYSHNSATNAIQCFRRQDLSRYLYSRIFSLIPFKNYF